MEIMFCVELLEMEKGRLLHSDGNVRGGKRVKLFVFKIQFITYLSILGRTLGKVSPPNSLEINTVSM